MIRRQVIGTGIILGILTGLLIDAYMRAYPAHIVYAREPEVQIVQIAVVVDWTRERIEKQIRDTFPEAPNTAVAIAQCESGLVADIQSRHTLSYGQERSFGIFQVHEPDWGKTAERLGLTRWKTDPAENITLARYIYDQSGSFNPWSCYRKKLI